MLRVYVALFWGLGRKEWIGRGGKKDDSPPALSQILKPWNQTKKLFYPMELKSKNIIMIYDIDLDRRLATATNSLVWPDGLHCWTLEI